MIYKLLSIWVILVPQSLAGGAMFPVAEKAARAANLTVLDALQPRQLVADFNGDGEEDVALFVRDRSTHKRGLCILHAGSPECVVLGGGRAFHAAGDDFRWVEHWDAVPRGESWATAFRSDGDVHGEQTVTLEHVSIRLCAGEAGCGVITFRNGRYEWVHQAD